MLDTFAERIKSKEFWKAALARALYTLLEVVLTLIPTSAIVLSDVNWLYLLSASALAAIVSLLKSLVIGLPEVK